MTQQTTITAANERRHDRPTEALPLRTLRLLLGYIWAMLLALSGVWVWMHGNELAQMLPAGNQAVIVAAAALCLAGAQFIFMLLVVDDLCPKAPATFTIFLKTFTGSIVWMSLAWLALLSWRWLQ